MIKQPSYPRNFMKRTNQHIELLFWLSAIVLLFFLNPTNSEFSLCVFRWIGIQHCPGCGLGHSIHSALHARFVQSFNEHLMGMPALIIIFHRISQLIYPKKTTIYEK